jgi:hypothetical protein
MEAAFAWMRADVTARTEPDVSLPAVSSSES